MRAVQAAAVLVGLALTATVAGGGWTGSRSPWRSGRCARVRRRGGEEDED